jgi:hypothetical protein
MFYEWKHVQNIRKFIVLLQTSYNNEPTELDNNERQTDITDSDRSFCSMRKTGTYIIAHFRKQKP